MSNVLHHLKKCARHWRVNEVLRTRHHSPSGACYVNHDFGLVDKHRDIARQKAWRDGELRGVENSIFQSVGPEPKYVSMEA